MYYSPSTRKVIDDEVRKLCEASYKRARDIIEKNRKDLDRLAKALLEYETLSGGEIQLILKGKALDRKKT